MGITAMKLGVNQSDRLLAKLGAPSSPRQLEFAIRRGLGRGLIWASKFHDGKWFDAIIRGILSTDYDDSFDDRFQYLGEIIELLPDSSAIGAKIEEAMFASPYDYLQRRLYNVLWELAFRDLPGAKLRYRDVLDRWSEATSSMYSLEDVLDVLGWSGLDSWLNSPFGRTIEPWDIADVVGAHGLDVFLDRISQCMNTARAEELRVMILNPPPIYERATKAQVQLPDFDEVAESALNATDVNEFARYRRVIRRHKRFDRSPAQVAEALLKCPQLAEYKWALLEYSSSPTVRDWALSYLDTDLDVALDALETRMQPEDWELIEPKTRGMFHTFALFEPRHYSMMSVRILCESNLHPRMVPTLVNIYDHCGCGVCRGAVAKLIQRIQPLPQRILDELPWNAEGMAERTGGDRKHLLSRSGSDD